MTGIRFALLVPFALACAACHAPKPPPTDQPPEPQATAAAAPHTGLSDAIQAPIQKARAAEAQVQAATDRTREAVDNADASADINAP